MLLSRCDKMSWNNELAVSVGILCILIGASRIFFSFKGGAEILSSGKKILLPPLQKTLPMGHNSQEEREGQNILSYIKGD